MSEIELKQESGSWQYRILRDGAVLVPWQCGPAGREACVTQAKDRFGSDLEVKYPDQYLHVRDERSGQEWVVPITARQKLDLATRVREWVKAEFGGELRLNGDPAIGLGACEYYARIITDGRPPDSVVVWDSGGFYLRSTSAWM